MLLATSFSKNVADRFVAMAEVKNLPPVLYIFYFDPQRPCSHVNYVQNSLVAGEDEYLFAVYSAFVVRSVFWKEIPTSTDPHVIGIDVCADNSCESEDLPLAPRH